MKFSEVRKIAHEKLWAYRDDAHAVGRYLEETYGLRTKSFHLTKDNRDRTDRFRERDTNAERPNYLRTTEKGNAIYVDVDDADVCWVMAVSVEANFIGSSIRYYRYCYVRLDDVEDV